MQAQSLFGLEGLTDFGLRSGVDVRPTLLRVLTDLYVHKLGHTADEERHYTELALRLLEAVDVATRLAVARRLTAYSRPPVRVLQWLSRDIPEIAAAVRADALPQPSADFEVAPPLPTAAPSVGDDMAPDPKRCADTSSAIDLATAKELNELFFAATAEERRLILLNLNIVAPLPAEGTGVSHDPSVSRRLEAAALARNREDFAQQLARALRIPREQARRMARDDLGESVMVAAKALGVPRDVLHRILLFFNPAVGHSVARVHALAALYDDMTVQAAHGMVAIWQALQQNERAATKHQPVNSNEAMRRGARSAPVTQRSAAGPRTNERRNAS
jgi:hypothetical protein